MASQPFVRLLRQQSWTQDFESLIGSAIFGATFYLVTRSMTTVIFNTLKDGGLHINSLASNICFSYRNVFQTLYQKTKKILKSPVFGHKFGPSNFVQISPTCGSNVLFFVFALFCFCFWVCLFVFFLFCFVLFCFVFVCLFGFFFCFFFLSFFSSFLMNLWRDFRLSVSELATVMF